MSARLTGRTAIVTGASRGLGRATAVALAAEGAAVAVVARTEAQWDERLPGTIGETVAAIEAAGGRAVAIRADLLEAGDIPRLVDEARAALGPITILVNNAAFTAPGRPPAAGAEVKPKAAKPSTGNSDWPGFVSTPLAAYRRHFEIDHQRHIGGLPGARAARVRRVQGGPGAPDHVCGARSGAAQHRRQRACAVTPDRHPGSELLPHRFGHYVTG